MVLLCLKQFLTLISLYDVIHIELHTAAQPCIKHCLCQYYCWKGSNLFCKQKQNIS